MHQFIRLLVNISSASSKVVAQITVCLSTMNVFFKNTQSTLLEEYCKVFLNHYEELEKYIEKNKAEIHEDEDLLMVWKENYESIETFCRDILQNDSMAEQVANSRSAHFATVTDLTDMIGAMSCT